MDSSLHNRPIVIKMKDGTLVKGTLVSFEPDRRHVVFAQAGLGEPTEIPVDSLKAIFFVRSLAGDQTHRKTKVFSAHETHGPRILVRFQDGELMTGFLEGALPWSKGFHTSKPDPSVPGFMIQPSDPDSNNERIYVVNSAVTELTRL